MIDCSSKSNVIYFNMFYCTRTLFESIIYHLHSINCHLKKNTSMRLTPAKKSGGLMCYTNGTAIMDNPCIHCFFNAGNNLFIN